MRRRIEFLMFERERVVGGQGQGLCPVCLTPGALLTTAQAAAFLQVSEQSVRRWLVAGRAHGLKTPGGRHRICRQSLLREHAHFQS